MNERLSGWRSALVIGATVALVFAAGCSTIERMTGRGEAMAQGSKVTLSGAEEVPPTGSRASGSGTLAIATDGAVSGSFKTTGVAATMAHIHLAPRGVNGPVIVPLTRSGDDTWLVPGGTKLTAKQLQAYQAGNLYVNVHSAQFPGGEVRGQVKP